MQADASVSLVGSTAWLADCKEGAGWGDASRRVTRFRSRIFRCCSGSNLMTICGHPPLKDVFQPLWSVIEVSTLPSLRLPTGRELRSLYRDVDRSKYWLWPLDPDELTEHR